MAPRAHPFPSPRVRVKRLHERAAYDRDAIAAVLDAGLVAHLGFVSDGQPYVIPTLQARVDELVYVHGSAASRTLRALAEGIPACLTVTLLDGIVLARSVFEHSMNYRSVVVLGTAVPVAAASELIEAHRAAGAALTVVVGADATGRLCPSGIYVFDRRAFDFIPEEGFQDIKERLIP